MNRNIVSTPTHERCVTSYAARTQYKPGTVHPPYIKVKDAIDIHCHAHEGQQDPYDLARRASLAEMKGLLFKSIPGEDPVKATRDVQEDVNRWADKEGVTITCWAGYVCGRQTAPVSAKIVREMIDRGVTAIWLPVFNHAITLSTVGTYRRVIDGDNGWHGPLPWDKAVTLGHYDLDADGELKKEIKEIVPHLRRSERCAFLWPRHAQGNLQARRRSRKGRLKARRDRSSFQSVLERLAGDDERAFSSGNFFNFTWDELSPLLGVDPQIMYNTIRDVGPEHFTLSSDAGEPLFPDSVEAMRLVRGYMEAFGFARGALYGVYEESGEGGRLRAQLNEVREKKVEDRGSKMEDRGGDRLSGGYPYSILYLPSSTQLS